MGCCQKSVKYSLFFTNFLVFVLGLVTLGFGIWVLVDKPSFLDLFSSAQDILNEHDIGDTSSFEIGVYAGAPIILIVVAVLTSLIAFFGCCGAVKENKCMLITYFIILLAIFIACIVGAVFVNQGKFEDEIKKPLNDAVVKYNDSPADDSKDAAFKAIFNEVQAELRCCGVEQAADWKTASKPDWDLTGANKPAGCCKWSRGQDTENTADQIKECRKADYTMTEKYYFKGCYDSFTDQINKQQDKIFAAAIATIVVMFLDMLCAFALCTMAE